jgi:hypothetical protein
MNKHFNPSAGLLCTLNAAEKAELARSLTREWLLNKK